MGSLEGTRIWVKEIKNAILTEVEVRVKHFLRAFYLLIILIKRNNLSQVVSELFLAFDWHQHGRNSNIRL